VRGDCSTGLHPPFPVSDGRHCADRVTGPRQRRLRPGAPARWKTPDRPTSTASPSRPAATGSASTSAPARPPPHPRGCTGSCAPAPASRSPAVCAAANRLHGGPSSGSSSNRVSAWVASASLVNLARTAPSNDETPAFANLPPSPSASPPESRLAATVPIDTGSSLRPTPARHRPQQSIHCTPYCVILAHGRRPITPLAALPVPCRARPVDDGARPVVARAALAAHRAGQLSRRVTSGVARTWLRVGLAPCRSERFGFRRAGDLRRRSLRF